MNSRPVRRPSAKLQHPMVVYSAFSISRRGSARSIKGLIPSSLEMASDSASSEIALAPSPSASRSLRVSA